MNNDNIEQQFPYPCRTWHSHVDVAAWCEEHFGEFGQNWYRYGTDIAQGIVAGAPLYDTYRFARDQDAVLFTLRWA